MLQAALSRFGELPPDAWAQWGDALYWRELAAGDEWVCPGKQATEMALVTQGLLMQYYLRDGEARATYFYLAPSVAAALPSLLLGQPSEMGLVALEPTQMLCWRYAALQQLYDEFPEAQAMGRKLAEYLALGLEERMVSLLLQSPAERYASWFAGPRQRLLQTVPLKHLASYLGITPVSLSRIRDREARQQSVSDRPQRKPEA